MAKFEKGNAGRPKGAKNKATLSVRDEIEKYFVDKGGINKLLLEIDSMDSERDRVAMKIKLIEFIVPKQKEITSPQLEGLKFKIVEDADSDSNNKAE